jgi:hypothetical protein
MAGRKSVKRGGKKRSMRKRSMQKRSMRKRSMRKRSGKTKKYMRRRGGSVRNQIKLFEKMNEEGTNYNEDDESHEILVDDEYMPYNEAARRGLINVSKR